jgi:hypothetical protein
MVKAGDHVVYVASQNARTGAPARRCSALVLDVFEGGLVDLQYVSPHEADKGLVVCERRVPFCADESTIKPDATKIVRPYWIQAG